MILFVCQIALMGLKFPFPDDDPAVVAELERLSESSDGTNAASSSWHLCKMIVAKKFEPNGVRYKMAPLKDDCGQRLRRSAESSFRF